MQRTTNISLIGRIDQLLALFVTALSTVTWDLNMGEEMIWNQLDTFYSTFTKDSYHGKVFMPIQAYKSMGKSLS